MYTLELGYVNAGFIFFGLALLGTLVFGRFFCGWGCHIVALQDLCGWIMKRLGVRPRPFRSRLLLYAPLVLAFYMFAWPTVKRVVLGVGPPFPGFTNHLLTSEMWATFPGPLFAVLTFATCGFAAVYFLGNKGFCTYGCPYGAMFGALDRVSPGKIVVSDACEQCGHCTATCTSNVRVHEEVRLYGMVVDPGCMKCMDCVSVCPKGALSFSFAKPALFKGKPATPPAKVYDLPLSEELGVAAVAALTTLVFRDLYNGPPLLMSIGLAAITAFLALKLWHLLRRPAVRLNQFELKGGGRMRRPGWAFAALTVLWLAFTSHSAFAQWHRAWGRHYLNQTEATHQDVLSGASRGKRYSSRHAEAAAEAYHHFSLADRWGLRGVVEVKLGLAWCRLLQDDYAGAAQAANAALALAPDQAELRQNVADVAQAEATAATAARAPTAEEHFQRGTALAEAGRLEEAAAELAACVEQAPESAPARFNLGGVLRRLGRNEAAVEQLEIARRLAPADPDVCVELGLAYQAAGDRERAIEALQRAIALNPGSPEAQHHLPELIEELESK